MKILSRYILKDFIKSFIISMFVIYGLLLIQVMIKLMDKFLGKGLDTIVLAELLFYNTASILSTTIPMAILIASILTYNKLSSNNEIVAFRASGINDIKIIKPTFIISIFICLITIYFSSNILPEMNYKAWKFNRELKHKRPDIGFDANIYENDIPNHIIKFKKRNKTNKSKFYDVTIDQFSNNKLKRTIIADSVNIESDNQNILFDLFSGSIHERVDLNEEYRKINFQNYKLNINLQDGRNQNINYPRTGDRLLTLNMLLEENDSLQNIIDDKMDKINKRLSIFSLEPIDFNQRGELIKSLELISKDSLNKITDIGKKKLYDRQTTSNQRIISNYIKNIDRNVNKINKNTVEVHKKFALPISIIIFLLIGAPLGIQLKRGGIGMSMAISLMFFILYYILIVGGEKLADKNQLDPILAMWLPNIIILIFGYALIFKLKKN